MTLMKKKIFNQKKIFYGTFNQEVLDTKKSLYYSWCDYLSDKILFYKKYKNLKNNANKIIRSHI
jgi:hypothetical protein